MQFPIDPILTLIKILDMQLQYITNRTIEHVEAWRLLNLIRRFADVNQIEDRRQNLVHSLHILDSGVELGVDVEDAGHVVVAVGLALLLLVGEELLVGCLLLPVDHLEFLAAGAGEEGDH